MNDEIQVAICQQCGGVTVAVVSDFVTDEDRVRLRRAQADGDVIETIPRGRLSLIPVCRGHAVENGDLFGGGE